jgi:hypothetical protein
MGTDASCIRAVLQIERSVNGPLENSGIMAHGNNQAADNNSTITRELKLTDAKQK